MPTYPQPGRGISTLGLNKTGGFATPPDKGINHTAGLSKSGLDTAGYPVVGAVAQSGVGATGATITWTTDAAAPLGVVRYGTDRNMAATTTKAETGTPPLTNHTVALTGLTGGTTYYYRIEQPASAGGMITLSNTYSVTTTGAAGFRSGDGTGDGASAKAEAGATLQDTSRITDSQDLFTNGPPPQPNTAFTITDLRDVNVMPTEATIQWRTSVYADGTLSYRVEGTSGPDTVVEEMGVKRLNHSVDLFDLQPETTYRVAVVSADSSGNLVEGGPLYLTTDAR